MPSHPSSITPAMSDMSYRGLLSLQGRVFVVLGAGQGIGEQVSHALSECGATVVCVDSDPWRAQAVAETVHGIPVSADITQASDMERVFQTASALPASGPLGLVDVVGMVIPNDLTHGTESGWSRQFQLVLDHAWLAMRVGARAMQGRGGSMVFIGSIAGTVVRSGAALAYASAKAALHHLVKGVAQDLAPQGIRVNAVAPGLTRTPRLVASNPDSFWTTEAARIPLRRVGMPSDIAAAVLFLSSPLADFVTGQILAVDGGSSLASGGGFNLAASGPAPT
ncbi:MAG: SDR family oxidoreductase [Limnohabitans sp.]|nr:SDR family oxidoreductase [Limnohabitans sp.]